MKLTPKHPRVIDVAQVLVDGKPLVLNTVLEVDTDEGYVVTAQPVLPTAQDTVDKAGAVAVKDEDITEFDYEQVKLTGTVEVRFKDGTTTLDN